MTRRIHGWSRRLNGGTRALIPSHKRTYFQSASVGKYRGSTLALASRRGAVSDKTSSQAMTTPSTRSSSSGEPRELSKSHEVQQVAPCCRSPCLANWEDSILIGESKHPCLPCLSTKSCVIGTSTHVQRLKLYLHLPRLSNRKGKANKFMDV